MSPATFCTAMLEELAHELADEQWVRGARAVCEMYASVDGQRFEAILDGLTAVSRPTALSEGAFWVKTRWRAQQKEQLGKHDHPRM